MLELDPNFYNAAYGKATCENIIGRYDDAIESYSLAFAKDSEVNSAAVQSRKFNNHSSKSQISP